MYAPPLTWRLKDRLIEPRFPMVMGIINATTDSFHGASRATTVDDALHLADRLLTEGASILDIGGASSRPGSSEVPESEELGRVVPIIEAIARRFPDALLSIDTWRARVAHDAANAGAGMVNDIGAGLLDEAMFNTVAKLGVPYVAMHMQGTPATMQQSPVYGDVAAEVTLYLSQRLSAAHNAGIADVILDPGFGFGKSTAHNYTLLKELPRVKNLGAPLLLGLSRKRMINEVLGTKPEEALNGTTSLNTIALLHGADILRVHDVKEAVECVRLVNAWASAT
ncbi:MAG: dihydropteroate synthase [Flavobacteriales bacterium]|nr:MAG: dihydropteroate synthase [Flavobacteriales bacterium]